jgi:tellurite resistance protein
MDDFSEEDRRLLRWAPIAVISAVIGSSPGGPVSIMQETGAAVQFFEQTAESHRNNPLIAEALIALKDRFETYFQKPQEGAANEINFFELGKDPNRALEACRETNILIKFKADPSEADEYRRWLVALADSVAKGAKEGGFMGIGGELVNDKERAILESIARILGVEPPAAT